MKLGKYFRRGDHSTLDAGSGNGSFSYYACSLGNRVLGINIDREQIDRSKEFRDFIGLDEQRCQFKLLSIYDVKSLNKTFDQIICFETLEHLAKDAEVLRLFQEVLNSDGVLHISVPRRVRKPYCGEVFSDQEDGGHLRYGYELVDLEAMLTEAGFSITHKDQVVGLFSLKVEEALNWLDLRLPSNVPGGLREVARALLFVFLYPFTLLDPISSRYLCIYVQARLSGQLPSPENALSE
jgi:SAM-dependent methyltransferase